MMTTYVLLTLRKQANESLQESFGKCCGNTVLTAVFYWPPIHFVPAQTFVYAYEELYHNRSR